MRCRGGANIGDGSLGRDVQNWAVEYQAGLIKVMDATGLVQYAILATGVLGVSLAFDQNMSPCIAYMKADGARLYYYDSVLPGYTTLFFAGYDSCRLAVDKLDSFFEGQSDVMLAYTVGGQAYFRQQRDRFNIQYPIGPAPHPVMRFGPSIENRLQLQLLTP